MAANRPDSRQSEQTRPANRLQLTQSVGLLGQWPVASRPRSWKDNDSARLGRRQHGNANEPTHRSRIEQTWRPLFWLAAANELIILPPLLLLLLLFGPTWLDSARLASSSTSIAFAAKPAFHICRLSGLWAPFKNQTPGTREQMLTIRTSELLLFGLISAARQPAGRSTAAGCCYFQRQRALSAVDSGKAKIDKFWPRRQLCDMQIDSPTGREFRLKNITKPRLHIWHCK